MMFDPYLAVELALDTPQAALLDPAGFDSDGALHLNATTLSQQSWLLLVSTNLTDWHSIATNTSGDQVFEFIDQDAYLHPARFYRLESAPGP